MITKLSDVADIYLGLTHTPKYVDEGVPFLSVKDISGGKLTLSNCHYITPLEYENLPSGAKPQPGDMLFCRVGTLGKPLILDADIPRFGTFVSLGFLRLKTTDSCSLKYLYYWMYSDSFWKQVESNVKGASQINLNTGWLKNFELPLYGMEQEYKIIEHLDKVTDLIDKHNLQLQKLDELIKARFVESFGSIYNNIYDFRIVSLQDVCEPIKDGTHQTPAYTDDKENGYMFLSSKDVTSGKINWNDIKYIPDWLHKDLYARIAPRKGDLLLAKNGTTGIAAIVDKNVIFDIYVSLALLRPIDVNSVYLWGAVNSAETKRQFDESLKGIGVPNLHLGEIKKTKIILPPIELQNQFADFVEKVDRQKEQIQKSLEKLEILKKSLMQKYFG